MGYQFKSCAMAFVLLGLGLGFFAQNGGGLAEASTRYGLSTEAEVFVADCQNALHEYDRDFAPEVTPAKGCACLAGQIAQTNSSDFAAAGVLVTSVVALPTTPRQSKPDWATIATDAGITDMKLGELLQVSYTAMGTCSAV